MTDAPSHIIHQLNVEAVVGNMAAAKKLEQGISTFIQSDIIPLVERLLNTIMVDEMHYRFDNITINVAVNETADIEEAIRAAVSNQLQQAFQQGSFHTIDNVEKRYETTGKTTNSATETDGSDAEVISGGSSLLESFFYFLQHGRLPWWQSASNPPFEGVALAQAITRQEAVSIQRLRALMQASSVAVSRLVLQFPHSLLVFFAGLLLPLPVFQLVMESYAALEADTVAMGQNRSLQVYFWLIVFNRMRGTEVMDTGRAAILKDTDAEEQIKNRIDTMLAAVFHTEAGAKKKIADLPAANTFSNQLSQTGNLPAEYTKTVAEEEMVKVGPTPVDEMKNQFPSGALVQKMTGSGSEKNKNEANHLLPEGLVVANAGLVLLHSFLPALFRETGLLAERDFISDAARHTAVHLLHYLATGREAAPEYSMSFEKYLSGTSPEEPLERFIPLTADMKTESAELLQAVISHWSKLGNTSPAALQETFLQRPGKLITTEGRHRLIMEQATTDILLNYLPWSMGIITLPWLPNILYVEWDNR